MPSSKRKASSISKTKASSQKSSGHGSKSASKQLKKPKVEEVVEISSDGEEQQEDIIDNEAEDDDEDAELSIPETPVPKRYRVTGKLQTKEEGSSKKHIALKKQPKQVKIKSEETSESDIKEDSDDVFGESKGKEKAKSPTLASLGADPTSEAPPDRDESDVGSRDSALKSTYKGLVNIRLARMHSWSDKIGNGQPSYSAIIDSMPKINKQLLHSAIIFQQGKNSANLSRVDPTLISTGHLGQTYFHLLNTPGMASIFTSVILVDTCNLHEPKHMPNSKPFKSITGTLIEGKWERLVGAIGMVLHIRDFKAQLFRDNLSFTTAPSNVDDSPRASPIKKGQLFRGQQSPFTHRPNTGITKTNLSFNNIVPVYDGRNVKEQFAKVITNFSNLPSLGEDITYGSVAVVGYTINTFTRRNDDMTSLSFNVHWVMLLGT